MKYSKFYKTKIGTLYRKLCGMLVSFLELFVDKRLAGMSLRTDAKGDNPNRASSEPIRYAGLKALFDGAEFNDDDRFLDIGCGTGRALAYVNSIFDGSITGVEYNPSVASVAQKWSKQYDNIEVISGDAFDLDFNNYNIIYMFNPFYDDEIKRLISQIEDTVTHPIKLYYYGDIVCGKYFNKREHWSRIKRDFFFKKGIICVQYYPQRYTIWEYNPESE